MEQFSALMFCRARSAQGSFVVRTSRAVDRVALAILPVALLSAPKLSFTPSLLSDALMVGVFSSALPFSLEIYALTRMHTRVYGTLTSLEPAVGALAGLVMLHELPSAMQVAGIAAVVVASVGTSMSARSEVVRDA